MGNVFLEDGELIQRENLGMYKVKIVQKSKGANA